MSWKLNNIDFSDYGVYISKFSGLFDMAKIINQPFDWLDEDGEDYWHDISEQKYADREINLHCVILNDTYDGFILKLKLFYDALKSATKKQLTTPYTPSQIECFLEKEISIDRKSRYIGSRQAGVFILTLTVPGDPDFMQLDIERWTGTKNIITASVFTNNLKIHKTLQGDMYATCSFESNTKLDLKYFDKIDIVSNGGNEDRFLLESDPEFKKVSTNKYQYNLRFEHQSNWLSHSAFKNDRNEGEFQYFANLEEIVDLILTNHTNTYSGAAFLKGTIVSTERRNHQFNAESCLEVLRRICKEYDVEYEFVFDNYTYYQYTLNIASQVANDTAITLQYGKGQGLYSITRGSMLKDELCTIAYGFGAAKNLKPDYRNGIGRLSFDENPLKNNEDPLSGYGPHEKILFFDDIYPQRSASVIAYEQKLPTDLPATMSDAELYTDPEGIYKITDTTIDFDINSYLLDGLTAKIRMKSGDLAGYEFEIKRYEHGTKSIFIIPFKDEQGYIVPNETLTISGESTPGAGDGDEYTLVDIDQPTSYVTAAETDVKNRTAAHVAEFSIPKYPYVVNTDPAFIDGVTSGVEVGDRATVIDTDYGLNGLLRIQNLTYDVYRKTYELTLLDLAYLTRRQQIELRLSEIERAMHRTGWRTVESIRKNIETTAELRARILDPYDDSVRADKVFRNETIDPRHLAYDSTGLNWSLKGALLIENVGGDEDEITIEAGTLTIHNWAENTMTRREIVLLRAGGGTYDPSRSWTIPLTNISLATKNAYYIYAKVPLDAAVTSCTIEVSETPIEMKEYVSTGYLMYELGTISAGEE